MARTRADYETKSAKTTLLHFPAEPPQHWVWRAIHHGATRIDVIGQSLFAKFPTWRQGADFHDHVNIAGEPGDTFQFAVPVAPLHTYETLIANTLDHRRRNGKPTRIVTYMPTIL